jgi:hypothetical protein
MFWELFLLVAGILGIAILAMGINVFFRKNKKFPESSIGGNKDMRKLGLKCAKHEEIKCRRDIDGLASGSASCGSCGHTS